MAYQALLFCPEEKTARTVTQILSELEFSVEPCTEPFAAVKKLMSQHFDAVVVDCDNEQNATLLFKSARNSTSNQASLAVAIVEGQAGVAKAFRIGANLVLTKPINVEQSKGTLRVARGLLRKGEPVKPAAATAPAPAPTVAAPKPPAPKPVAPVKTQTASVPLPPVAPRPSTPPVGKPAATLTQARTAAATRTIPAVQATTQAKTVEPPVAPVHAPAPVATDAESKPAAPAVIAKAPELASPAVPAAPASKPTFVAAPEGPVGMFTAGAASAPALAREVELPPAMELPAVKETPVAKEAPAETQPHPAEELFEKTAATAESDASAPAAGAEGAPSFTFGGANEPEPSGGIGRKLLPIAAILILAVGAYFGWSYFQGRQKQPAPSITSPAVTTPAQPSSAPPASAPSKPSAFSSLNSQPETKPAASEAQTSTETEGANLGSESSAATQPSATKPSTPTSSSIAKGTAGVKPASEPEAEPLVVKGGSAPVTRPAVPVTDTAAPSMIGIASTGSDGALSDIAGGNKTAPQPVLQALHISQGVSQGLLLKRVQPVYPKNALSMRIEGAVELMATISKTGVISSVKVLKGDQQLSRAAVDAVKQWKYRPYLLNGEPVEIQTQITVNFKLPN